MITDRETDLRNDASKGLDLSPGNEVSAWAVEEIDRLREENENLRVCVEYWKDQWHRQTARLGVELEKGYDDLLQLLRSNVRWDGDRYIWVIYGGHGDKAQSVESAIAAAMDPLVAKAHLDLREFNAKEDNP